MFDLLTLEAYYSIEKIKVMIQKYYECSFWMYPFRVPLNPKNVFYKIFVGVHVCLYIRGDLLRLNHSTYFDQMPTKHVLYVGQHYI